MPILRLSFLVVAVSCAAGLLVGCKGSSSSSAPSGPMAMLRIVQGSPALQAVDYQIDSNGTLNVGALPGVVQPYLSVTAATHTVSFFESGTKTPASPPGNCPIPALTANARYTLVIVNTSAIAGGTSATSCVLFAEPAVTASAGQGIVVYHNAAGNATVTDPTGKATATLYPIFCQAPAGGTGACTNPVTPSGATVVNGAATGTGTAVQLAVSYPTATSGAGIAFSVANAPGATPLCSGQSNDPRLLPVTVDSTDTSNFVPNGSSDQVIAIYVTDSVSATSGSNACPVTISGSLQL